MTPNPHPPSGPLSAAPPVPPGTVAGDQNPFTFLEPARDAGELGWLGQYRVLRLLGAGGMGYVFEAEDPGLRRAVALKVMKPDLAADFSFRERFLGEARAAAKLVSDYVVTVYQVGCAGDVPFLAMQLLYGESLQDKLERSGPLQVAQAVLVGKQSADGLAAAHEVGLVHRDIKPANLWLESEKPGGSFKRVRILDFGLARAYDQDTRLTATGVIVGTPHYMAPEQASGHKVDGRADLFSLGCVLFTSLTGEMPFDGPSTMAVLMSLANHTPPPLSEKRREVPPALSDLVARMIAKDPAARPQTAAEVAAELEAILDELPTGPASFKISGGIGMASLQRRGGTPTHGSRTTPGPQKGPGGILSGVRGPLGSAETPANAAGGTYVGADPARCDPTPAPGFLARRGLLLGSVLGAVLAAGGITAALTLGDRKAAPDAAAAPDAPPEPVPVGVLHSTSGTMAVSESPVVDATMLAIDEVNKAGGVLGRPLKPVHLDGKSDPDAFAAAADQLLTEEKVAVIFGCWTSASRRAVVPVVQRHNGALFYPVQYEGLEQSPRVVYLGPAANQQITPAVEYAVRDLKKKRFFLVGSDYVYPHAAHEVIKDDVRSRRGDGIEVAGEKYLPLGAKDVRAVVEAVRAAKPDVIFNTVNGTTNFHLFRALEAAGPGVADVPVISFSVMETDLRKLDPKEVAGNYLVGTYFQSLGTPAGREFLEKVRTRFGPEKTFSDPMAAAYVGVHLWARAAAAAGTVDPSAVLPAVRGLTFAGPAGTVRIDRDVLSAWLPVRVGRARPDGTIEVVSGSSELIRPDPFPPPKTRKQWDTFLSKLQLEWDGKWQAPATGP